MGDSRSFFVTGLLTDLVNTDILIGPFPSAIVVTQFSPSLIGAPTGGGSLAVSLRNAADGAGDSIDATFAADANNASETGTVAIAADGYAYLRVTAESGGPLDLGGSFLYESAPPTADIANEPLTLGDVKKHLTIPTATSDHDDDLENLIVRVREEAERLTGIPIVSQSKTVTLNAFPGGGDLPWWDGVREGAISALESGEIELPPGNLQSITSLTTYDDSDAATVMSSANYFVDTVRNRIVLRNGQAWPSVTRVANGVVIVALMGWATPSVVPEGLKERLKERVAQRWQARPESSGETLSIDSSFYAPWVRRKLGQRAA